MKSLRKTLLFCCIFAAIVIAAICLSGCFGHTARTNALPVIAELWTNLRPDAAAAVVDPNDLTAMDTAVQSGIKADLLSAWTQTHPFVVEGIHQQVAADPAMAAYAESKTETVLQLTNLITAYAAGP